MRILIIAAMLLSPSVALAEPPTEAELEKAVAEMRMPSFEARLKAKAAVARLVVQTAERYGFGEPTGIEQEKTEAPILVAERIR
jgi:hypothetical protein